MPVQTTRANPNDDRNTIAIAQLSLQWRYLASIGLHPEWSAVGHVPAGQSEHWVTCDVLAKDFPIHFAQLQQHSGN